MGNSQMDPKKSIFLAAQARVPVCFDVGRYLADKYFDIVWGYYPPKNQFLEQFNLGCQFFLYISRC